MIAGIEVVKWVLVKLDDPKIFDTFPLRYVFDAMDVALLLVFLVMGTMHAIFVFRSE